MWHSVNNVKYNPQGKNFQNERTGPSSTAGATFLTSSQIRTKFIEFFQNKSPESLILCDLRDNNKWKKIGDFIGIDVLKQEVNNF